MGFLKNFIEDIAFSLKFEIDNRNTNNTNGRIFGDLKNTGRTSTTQDDKIEMSISLMKAKKMYRKEIEDLSDKIHPLYGKFIKKIHNIEDTLENAADSLDLKNVIMRDIFDDKTENDLKLADSIYVQCVGFTHHGLYIGNGKVIHYTGDLSDMGIGIMPAVRIDTLQTFSGGKAIHRKSDTESPLRYSREEVISRAYSRLGEQRYNLFDNNCDSFVNWCRFGGEEAIY